MDLVVKVQLPMIIPQRGLGVYGEKSYLLRGETTHFLGGDYVGGIHLPGASHLAGRRDERSGEYDGMLGGYDGMLGGYGGMLGGCGEKLGGYDGVPAPLA
jgi:hypothetical protein